MASEETLGVFSSAADPGLWVLRVSIVLVLNCRNLPQSVSSVFFVEEQMHVHASLRPCVP